jgi:hypothetical protein
MAGKSPSPRGPARPRPRDAAVKPRDAAVKPPAQAPELPAQAVEPPTQAAELKFTVGPATAGGTVPQAEAHHFVTVCGIAGSVAAGIAGVILTLRIASGVLTLRVSSGLAVLALAELGLGLAGAVLIAFCSRRPDQPGQEEPE